MPSHLGKLQIQKVQLPSEATCALAQRRTRPQPSFLTLKASNSRSSVRRKCDDVVFLVTRRTIDTDALTKKLIKKEVEEALAPLLGEPKAAGLIATPSPAYCWYPLLCQLTPNNGQYVTPLLCTGALGILLAPIPGVGTAISAAAAATAAGLDLNNLQTKFGIDIQPADMLVHATNGEVFNAHTATCMLGLSSLLACLNQPCAQSGSCRWFPVF